MTRNQQMEIITMNIPFMISNLEDSGMSLAASGIQIIESIPTRYILMIHAVDQNNSESTFRYDAQEILDTIGA